MKLRPSFVLVFAISSSGAIACFTGTGIPDAFSDQGAAPPGTGKVAAVHDLPCDVAELLLAKCLTCHGSRPIGNPLSLASRADLVAQSKTDPTKTVVQLSIARMKDTAKPMPPTGMAAASEAAVLEKWVADGMPTGNCQTAGGAGPYDTPTVCSSNVRWTRGDDGSKSMHPGGTCIACHNEEREGPRYTIAGTVFPTAHEPTDCNGLAGAVVVITDGAGRETRLNTNAAGNFYSTVKITGPYTAKVIANGKERAMIAPQTSGDCNTCHSEAGTSDAPGRVMAP